MATPLTLQTTVSDITFYLSSTDSSKDEPLLTYIKSGTTSRSPILDTDLEPKFLNGIVQEQTITVKAILGAIQLALGSYLVVVTESTVIGHLFGHPISEIKGVSFLPLFTSTRYTKENENRAKADSKYIAMLRSLIESGFFYYSHGYDLTNSLQRIALNQTNVVDERFQWNKNLLSKFERLLIEQTDREHLRLISPWMVSMIWGFISIQSATKIGEHVIDIALISRRDRHRAGTRFNKRGCNRHGDVANYVETEQILVNRNNAKISSYVQVRGSVPLLWEQPTNLEYEPKIQLRTTNTHGHIVYFRKHFDHQMQIYGEILVLSLLKTNDDHEGLLSHLYKQHIEMLKNPKIHFVDFDITREIGYLNNELFTAMDKIFSKISDISQQFGFFLADGSSGLNDIDNPPHNTSNNNNNNKISMNDIAHQWKILRQQSGVIRTNCKDNVDRTSLVQTSLTLQILREQMRSVGVDPLSQEEEQKVEVLVRNMCADNSDTISLQYTGTKSMRNEIIRGRTFLIYRAINDFKSALLRYFFAQFQDGPRQDAIDLLRKEFVVGVHDMSYRMNSNSDYNNNNNNNNNNTNNNNTNTNSIITNNERSLVRGMFGFITRIIVTLLMLFRPSTTWMATSHFGMIYGLGWVFWLVVVWRVFRIPYQHLVVRPALRKQQPRRFQ